MAYGAIIGQTPTVQASAEMTSYNNDNTSSVITADNVQGAIDQLFTSVSNGKSQIASAITDMGVSTSANDSFAQMATNIGNIETGYDTSQVTATANTVRSGYKFVNSSGQLITGTIPSKGAQTYTPKTVSQTIAKGQYLSGNQTIQGDENLKASNIKNGVSIFGVRGNCYSIEAKGNVINTISIDGQKVKIYFKDLIPPFNSRPIYSLFFGHDSGIGYIAATADTMSSNLNNFNMWGTVVINGQYCELFRSDNGLRQNGYLEFTIMNDFSISGGTSFDVTESAVLYGEVV